MDHFELHSEYQPTGDQPAAIAELVKGFREGNQAGDWRKKFGLMIFWIVWGWLIRGSIMRQP
jgi:hypothetical protein